MPDMADLAAAYTPRTVSLPDGMNLYGLLDALTKASGVFPTAFGLRDTSLGRAIRFEREPQTGLAVHVLVSDGRATVMPVITESGDEGFGGYMTRLRTRYIDAMTDSIEAAARGVITERVTPSVTYGGHRALYRRTALILAVFLGVFGAHRFYAGKKVSGVIWLLTLGLFGLGWIADIAAIIGGTFLDSYGETLL